jgi:hypothetical protein
MEHIPPKSFFVKEHRENLIKVPSCDLHNQDKSTDDEYIRAILLQHINLHNNTNVTTLKEINQRALTRSVKRMKIKDKHQAKIILDTIKKYEDDDIGSLKAIDELETNHNIKFGLLGLTTKKPKKEIIKNNNGEDIITSSTEIDLTRIENFFIMLAKGIFYYKIGKVWQGKVNILPHFLFNESTATDYDKFLNEKYLEYFNKENSEGENKDFFYFDGYNEINPKTKKQDCIFFIFCFYDTFKITSIFPIESNI